MADRLLLDPWSCANLPRALLSPGAGVRKQHLTDRILRLWSLHSRLTLVLLLFLFYREVKERQEHSP